MKVSSSNKAIVSKAKSMYGKRLTLSNYRDLMSRRSIDEVAYQLKTYPGYQNSLDGLTDASRHPGLFEHLLRRTVFERYQALKRYDFTGDGYFYQHLTVTAEIQMINMAVRQIISTDPTDIIKLLPGYMAGHLSFNMLELAKVKNYEDLLRAVSGTEYHKILAPLSPPEDLQPDYFSIENALRQYQYRKLSASIDEFPPKTAQELRTLYKTLIDLINLANMYRMKVHFDENPDKIRSYMFSFEGHSHIKEKNFDRLITCSPDEFMQILKHTSYGKYIPQTVSSHFEHITHTIRYEVCKKMLQFSSDPAVVFATYLVLHEIEVENIINIIEGVRYSLPAPQIEAMLIL